MPAVRRHLIITHDAATVVALWIAHAWVYRLFLHSPRLPITSPTRRCGKSILLAILYYTVCRPVKADNISASGVFRIVSALRPLTLLLDEMDSYLAENEELRGVLNSGYEASGAVIRVEEKDGQHVPIQFPTYCPVALAAIGTIPGTLADRGVPVRMERKAPADKVTKLRDGGSAEFKTIARKLARWAEDAGGALPQSPVIPDPFNDREGDISVPLLSIADAAGDDWPARAREALLRVFGTNASVEAEGDTGPLLLGDIRTFFRPPSMPKQIDALPSEEICERLNEMEHRPWPEWRIGKPMTKAQLAQALRPFKIRPKTLRVSGKTPKGYERSAFEEAWSSYCTAPMPPTAPEAQPDPQHRNNQGSSTGSAYSRAATPNQPLRSENPEDRRHQQQCCDVAAEPPPTRGGERWEMSA